MSDEEGGGPHFELHAANLVAQACAHAGIERRERLVEQQDLRLDRERPRERHALLLATRKLAGVLVSVSGKPY